MAEVLRRRREKALPRRQGRLERFRSRHPYAMRALGNAAAVTALVAPIALSARKDIRPLARFAKAGLKSKLGREGRRAGYAAARSKLGKNFDRKRQFAYGIGIPGYTIALGGPLERYSYDRRERKRQARNLYEIPVVSMRTGKTRVIYGVQ